MCSARPEQYGSSVTQARELLLQLLLKVTEIKTVPFVPLSHPFVERLIGTLRRECLDRTLFWTTSDLEEQLLDFQHYYNEHRTQRAPCGNGCQHRLFTSKSQLLSMAEALSRLIPNADGRVILVIRDPGERPLES